MDLLARVEFISKFHAASRENSEPLSAPEQLHAFLAQMQQVVNLTDSHDELVFVTKVDRVLLHLAATCQASSLPKFLGPARRTARPLQTGRGHEEQTANIATANPVFRVMASLPVMVLQRWFHVDHFEVLSRLDYHPLRKSRGKWFSFVTFSLMCAAWNCYRPVTCRGWGTSYE